MQGPLMLDIDGAPLSAGDFVQSLRYEMGVCKVLPTETGFDYISVETGERVSYLKMVDAATSYQKVRRIDRQPT